MKTFISISLIFLCSALKGQPGFELQFGGSNFLGTTLNSSYEIYPVKGHNFSITPFVGVGSMLIGYSENAIIKAGVNQRIGKWGLGFEFSGFFENPFVPAFQGKDFIDMLVYPNFCYTTDRSKKIYLGISVGGYFAYSKRFDVRQGDARMQWEGDLLPGLGLKVGHRFNYDN